MTSIDSLTLDVNDLPAATAFYAAAFDLGSRLQLRASDAPTSGFRGFTLSLIVGQPSTVSALFDSAVAAGATVLKPVAKSLWGVGGVLQAPDGTVWKVATSAKKDTAPASREIDQLVLLLGSDDVAASKRFYVDHGFAVGKSFGKYVEFAMPGSGVGLAVLTRNAVAKDAGIALEGSGSHRLTIGSSVGVSPFTDPDGFAWESASATSGAAAGH